MPAFWERSPKFDYRIGYKLQTADWVQNADLKDQNGILNYNDIISISR